MVEQARELSALLDEVIFNLEHGLPLSVVNRLAAVGDRLATLDAPSLSEADLSDFRSAVEAVRKAEPDALDRLLLSAEHVLSTLQRNLESQ